jgi:hypothetical protein
MEPAAPPEARMRTFPLRPPRVVGLLAGGAILLAIGSVGATGRDEVLAREASWAIPDPAAVRARSFEWLHAAVAAGTPPAPAMERAEAAWRSVDGQEERDLLDAVVDTIAAAEPRAAALRGGAGPSGDVAWLDDTATSAFVRDAVRLWWARELVRHDRFDEALPILVGLDVAASVDPATLLFHRAACQHWLLDIDAAVETLDLLLEREAEIPARYGRIARLLRADAAALETESLDHIARRMRDAGRRLELGRTGRGTRDVQDGVVASLDRLIDRLENEQQDDDESDAAAGGGGGAGQGAAGRPMDDSRIAGARGAGDVRSKELAPGDGWGNLPPHERDRALQQIGREFPPHYREAIEQYFKRLATGGEER